MQEAGDFSGFTFQPSLGITAAQAGSSSDRGGFGSSMRSRSPALDVEESEEVELGAPVGGVDSLRLHPMFETAAAVGPSVATEPMPGVHQKSGQ